MQQAQKFAIVADIGGTNGRFALASKVDGNISLTEQRQYPSSESSSLLNLVERYKLSLPSDIELEGACLAVAGPVTDAGVKLTNLGWCSNVNELKAHLDLDNVELMNDFAAYANSVPMLPDHQKIIIKAATPVVKHSPVLVMGPGTGLGVAALVPVKQGWHPVACEGGHIALSANDELQAQIISILRKEFGHVSAETVLCGRGLVNLYRVLAGMRFKSIQYSTPAQITSAAMEGHDPLAVETLDEFCRWLGYVSGDLVLAQGARGGVVLGGGILPRIVDYVGQSQFMQAFMSKGVMSDYLKNVPVKIAMKSDTALNGAAAWFYR